MLMAILGSAAATLINAALARRRPALAAEKAEMTTVGAR
jgi:hypothetical protein